MRVRKLMVPLVSLALVGGAITVGQAAPLVPKAAAAGTPVLPNLKTLPPRDLRFDRTDTSVDGTGVMENVLRFSNTAVNAGEGKLAVYAQIDPTTKSGTAYQRVFDTAGGYTDYSVGTMYYHAVHNHYHYDNWGRFELWSKADYDSWVASGRGTPPPGAVKKVGSKTTSCIVDEEFQFQTAASPGDFPWSGCMPDSTGRLSEGLSPGWGDTYDYYRFEQWFDLGQSTLADGDYVIRSVADPDNKIYESANKNDPARESEQDNEGVTPLKVVSGKIVDQTNPTGTVAINHWDASTSSASVKVDVYGRDDVSGVDTFQLSNDGVTWSSPFTSTSTDSTPTTVAWDLTSAATGGTTATGTKTVYARLHDRAGHYSSVPLTDTIQYTGGSTTTPPPPPGPTPTDAYGKAVMTDAPTGYWRLGESSGSVAANTVSGGTAGTYASGVTQGQPSLVAGTTDPAALFDGVRGVVRIPFNSGVDASTAVSVEAWIKPTALPASGQWATVATKPESFSLQFIGDQIEFTIIQNGGVRQRMRAPSGTITAGRTYHLVGTYDGQNEKLYVNGKLIPMKALTGAIAQNPNGFNIGSWSGTSEFFNGTIDEVAVYKAALAAARVDAHYAAATGTSTTPSDTTAPSTPGSFAAKPVSASRIDLSWTASTDNVGVTGYNIYRNGSGTPLVTVSGSAVSWSDTTASASTTYTYQVSAVDAARNESAKASASATTPAETTTPPPTTSSYASTVLADGATGYWRLGETSGTTAANAVSGGPAGAYKNGAVLGQPGLTSDTTSKSVRLDGVDDLISIPFHSGVDASTAVSVEAWIKPSALPAAGQWASVATKRESFTLQFYGDQLEFTIIQNGVRQRMRAPSGTIVAGQTYHVIGTYDGSQEKLYVNGKLVPARNQTGSISQNLNGFTIGSWDGGSEFFNGWVDEVAVYKTALTQTQVNNHYAAGKL